MKFTEGYWLRSERANGLFAAEAYKVERIPDGMRILAPVHPIRHRGDTLNTPTITIEFRACAPDVIAVRAWHFEAYEMHLPHFEKNESACREDTASGFTVSVAVSENEALMDAGRVKVRVDRKNFRYSFEADGKTITSCGLRNLRLIRWDRKPSTMLPKQNYLTEDYEPYMLTELSLSVGECVYGLGERFSSFVKNGQSLDTSAQQRGKNGRKMVPGDI